MKKHKHIAYKFELHTIRLLIERNMSPIHLYTGWRNIPNFLISMQRNYYKNPTRKALLCLTRRDTIMYHGILQMIDDRKKRVSNVKSELLIKKNHAIMGWRFDKEVEGRYGLYDIYSGNNNTIDVVRKRSKLISLQDEFIRTGQVKFVSELRKLDKELVSDINKFLKSKK